MAANGRRDFLHPASAVAIMGFDMLAWLLDEFFLLAPHAPILALMLAFTGLCVAIIEDLGAPRRSLPRGLLGALLVWVPGPMAGTLAGVLALTWSLSVWLVEWHQRRHS
jgi:hypothetical protein